MCKYLDLSFGWWKSGWGPFTSIWVVFHSLDKSIKLNMNIVIVSSYCHKGNYPCIYNQFELIGAIFDDVPKTKIQIVQLIWNRFRSFRRPCLASNANKRLLLNIPSLAYLASNMPEMRLLSWPTNIVSPKSSILHPTATG